jgi:hypothetical protein
MKSMVKILTIAAMVLLTAAVFVNAEPQDNNRPGGERMGGGGRFVEKVLDDIRAKDPNEAARLEKLREENPQQFHREIRAIAIKDMPMSKPGMGLEHQGRGREEMGNMPGEMPPPPDMPGMPGMERGRERLRAMEGELMTWLQKNEPAEANSLTALKEKDPQAYMRKIAIDMKKYRQIMEVEDTNPALAEVLKKELKLKQQRNDLLEKFKAATDDKQKKTIKAELKDVVSQTFDVKLQKKQIKYDELKQKLEELQKNVNKSQTDLEKFKNDKDAQVDKYLESIISQSEQFDWD